MPLECENCGFEAPSKTCYDCRERVPAWANYCPLCGARLKSESSGAAAAVSGDPLSMENRRLCPDGNCIGILGADNRCVICGKS